MNYKNIIQKPIFFGIFHSFLFLILFSLFYHTPHSDAIENFFWGKEWQLGYSKHPPLFAILNEITTFFVKPSLFGSYLISFIAIFVTFIAIYFLSKEILPKKKAVFSVLLLTGILYSNIFARPWNANLVQIPFWALSSLFYFYSIKYNKKLYWALFGVFLAFGFLGKYFTSLLGFAILCSFFFNKKTRKYLKSLGPYIAILSFFATFLPHIMWLFKNDFYPFLYLFGRKVSNFSIIEKASFILFNIETIIFCIIGFFILCQNTKFKFLKKIQTVEGNFLFCITVLPTSFFLIFYIFLNINANDKWLAPCFFFLPIFLFYFFDGKITKQSSEKFLKILSVFLILLASYTIVAGRIKDKKMNQYFKELEEASVLASQEWLKIYKKPVKFVLGSIDEAGYFSLKSNARPSVIVCGNFEQTLYVKKEKVYEEGFVVIYSKVPVRTSCNQSILLQQISSTSYEVPDISPNFTIIFNPPKN